MLAGLVLDRLDALALLRPGDDHGRPARGPDGLLIRRVDRRHVVAVDLDRVPAERLRAALVGVQVPADHRLARLAEPVDVEDRGQVVEPVERGVLERLPHRPLGHLGVAAQHPDAVGQAVEPLAGEGDADADREALPERAGGHVRGRDPRRRVALQPRVELAEREELLLADDAGRLEHGVVQRRGVTLGEDQVVVGGVVEVGRVEPQIAALEQHRQQVGGRHRRRRVAGAGRRADAHGVDAQLLAQLREALGVAHAATSWSRLASMSSNSCWKDLANFSTPSRSSVSTTSS